MSDDFGLVDYESPKDLNPVEYNLEAELTAEAGRPVDAERAVEDERPVEAKLTAEAERLAEAEKPLEAAAPAESLFVDAEPMEEEFSVDEPVEAPTIDTTGEPDSYEAESDDNQLIDYEEEADFISVASRAAEDSPPALPEAWVYSEGEWMIYLGPDQSSFDYDYQMELYTMPLVQLIDALHTDILLRDDMELALEFPSLGLVIDRRDDACIDLSLQQLYNCHIAAVAMGAISVGLVHSPYFTHTPTESTFTPSHESFAFIIHTRPSVNTTLARIMQVVEEYNNSKELESTVPDSPHQTELPNEAEAEEVDIEDEPEEEEEDQQQQNGRHHHDGTASLLAENGEDDYEEDEDDDFVADEEEEGDHVLDDDAIDEDEEVEQGFEGEEEEAETHVESSSAAASPARKRTTDETVDCVDIADDNVNDEENSSEPVAKKSKIEEEIIHV
ncbi:hypothetical protein GGI23_004432 [Coemansia sp. RSA 2559]|nr:hypothetical protein GGI23_004432 [Coemansia sp. RSA 2559]KAJ2856033.1 hypothetical protein GGI22_003936 [Coemansia erecta]